MRRLCTLRNDLAVLFICVLALCPGGCHREAGAPAPSNAADAGAPYTSTSVRDIVVGWPTDRSVSLSVLAKQGESIQYEYGFSAGGLSLRTPLLVAGDDFGIEGLMAKKNASGLNQANVDKVYAYQRSLLR
jgi:hypothetical protein